MFKHGDRVRCKKDPQCTGTFIDRNYFKDEWSAHSYKNCIKIDDGKWDKYEWAIDHEPFYRGMYLERDFELIPELEIIDLKVLNSDGRLTCAKCNGNIKEPYPGIRYCPICE